MLRAFASTLVLIAGLLAFVSPVATTVAVNFDVADRLQDRLAPEVNGSRIFAGGAPLEHPGAVTLFYERRGYTPAWSTPDGPTDRADRLLMAIRTVIDDGFTADHYPLHRLERALRYAWHDPNNTAIMVELDLMLTDAFMRVSHDLAAGIVDPSTLGIGISSFNWDETNLRRIETGIETGRMIEALESFRPRQSQYERLRNALKLHLAIAQKGGWPEVAEGKTLRPGDNDPRIRQIRKRLAATDDLPRGTSVYGSQYDDKLVEAVKEFQRRYGLTADGIIGQGTVAAMNISPAQVAREIELNLERWRWLPEDLGRRHLWVDIPAGLLYMSDQDSLRLDMRVMIGRVDDPTPTFSDTMTYLVVNPYWEVPASIVMKKLYPYFSEDPTFFERHGIEVFSGWRNGAHRIDPTRVNWKSYDPGYLPFRFRQKPGPLNAMGRIKFMFPNPYHIYIHDTPSRYLFARERYAYTSGCVRVRRPIDLAEILLEDSNWWTEKRIHRELDKGDERILHLKRPIPVHLTYFTVVVDDDGKLRFHRDIYGWDNLLDSVLDSGVRQILAADPGAAKGLRSSG
ncbi:MAG: L,D-transpeptidase family protein [bacterium]